MIKKLTLLLLAATLSPLTAIAQKADTTKKFSLKFSGRIDAFAYFDTNNNGVELANGLIYFMPGRPTLSTENGEVLSNPSKLRFNVASTRFALTGHYTHSEKVSMGGYIEGDLMGTWPNGIMLGVRLRHAYGYANWGDNQFLFGQTSHLALLESIVPPTVTFTAGYPFNILSRPIQFRYSHNFVESKISLSVAASMFYGSMEYKAQEQGLIPDFSARLVYGENTNYTIGVMAGVKSLQPQDKAVVDKKQRMNSVYAGVMGQGIFGGGYAIRAMVVYGGDLSTFGMIGGYGPLLDLKGYAPINTLSTWIDFSTPSFKGFSFGVFGGYQDNLGSATDILTSEVQEAEAFKGINNYWRVAPRVWYQFKMLSFGLEYMYAAANWMHQWDSRYQSTFELPTSTNDRITLLCRFTF